jgi:hypothetical protein
MQKNLLNVVVLIPSVGVRRRWHEVEARVRGDVGHARPGPRRVPLQVRSPSVVVV